MVTDPGRRRRWPRILAVLMTLLMVALGTAVAVAQYGLPWWMSERDHNHSFAGQRYQVHVPPQYDGQAKLPVIVAIHGCGMTGFGWKSVLGVWQR